MKKVLYFAFALMALPRLYDFVFHAGHVHDLVAAAGFAVLLVGCLWDERARRACPPVARLRYRANAARHVRRRGGARCAVDGKEGLRLSGDRGGDAGMGQCPTRRLPCPQC
ncbi:TPA: hypothetical protein ACOFCO_003979 [Stenotrophomonas maltophilia]